jgi:Centromere DNA-binding protein complex CBF3 subunit, domain 2
MREIRAMAGFVASSGMHYNPRVAVRPPVELAQMVFPWVDDMLEKVTEHEQRTNEVKGTATNFLKLLLQLRQVVLQDTACYFLYEPEMVADHLYFQHPIFETPQFKVRWCCCCWPSV